MKSLETPQTTPKESTNNTQIKSPDQKVRIPANIYETQFQHHNQSKNCQSWKRNACLTIEQITQTIKNSKKKSTTGPDSIPNYALKQLPPETINIITQLCLPTQPRSYPMEKCNNHPVPKPNK